MTNERRDPLVHLDVQAHLKTSRVAEAAKRHQRLRTTKGEVCADTLGLPIPVRIVIEQEHLTALSGVINDCNREGNKQHNSRTPIFYWYQDTPVGKEAYIVLYTKPCEWGRCSFCTLPSQSSPVEVDPEDIYLQALLVFDNLSRQQLDAVRRVFLSNNGSILNPATMPRHTLVRICELIHEVCPNVEIICFETRFETATAAEMLAFQHWFAEWHRIYRSRGPHPRQADKPACMQISAGYETQDPYLRNAVLWKGYDESKVQEFFALCAQVREQCGRPVLLDEYVMLKPAAGMTNEEAIDEAVETILHLERLGEHFKIPVSVRLNPTFAAVGSELHYQLEARRYTPPTYRDLFQVLLRCRGEEVSIPIFLGLNNEGLSYSEGAFGNRDGTDPYYLRALTSYNGHQNFERLSQEITLVEGRLNESEEGRLLLVLQSVGTRLERLANLPVDELVRVLDEVRRSGRFPVSLQADLGRLGELLEPTARPQGQPHSAAKVSRT